MHRELRRQQPDVVRTLQRRLAAVGGENALDQSVVQLLANRDPEAQQRRERRHVDARACAARPCSCAGVTRSSDDPGPVRQ